MRRPNPSTLLALFSLIALALFGSGCALELDQSHPGWRDPGCWSAPCHQKASTHNADKLPYQCAECHGTNGAPAGHTGKTPCSTCHGTPHGAGFPDPEACQTCHP